MGTRIEISVKFYTNIQAGDEVNVESTVEDLMETIQAHTELRVWSMKAKRKEYITFPIVPRRERDAVSQDPDHPTSS